MHNLENVMAVLLAAQALRVDRQTMARTIKRFGGVEHRCEPVAVKQGVGFVNDSKSTTVDATVKALSMFADNSVVLICGGRDKGSDFRVIRELIRKKVSSLILIGEAAEKIAGAMKGAVSVLAAPTLEAAVRSAFERACPGGTVLLSPMCASFDMFDNFEHRGSVFKMSVRRLLKR
jgi:UDP-N-acetylmuramoylalanine--D-glutamate ligase